MVSGARNLESIASLACFISVFWVEILSILF